MELDLLLVFYTALEYLSYNLEEDGVYLLKGAAVIALIILASFIVAGKIMPFMASDRNGGVY